MSYRVTLIPGDGIGPEVIGATRRVIDAVGVSIEWDEQQAEAETFARTGQPLPPATLEARIVSEQKANARQSHEVAVDRFQLMRQRIDAGDGEREVGIVFVCQTQTMCLDAQAK